MKQVILQVEDNRIPFFMELVKSLDFVQVESDKIDDGDSKEEIIANLTEAFKDLQLLKDGKLKTSPAREFLNEL